MKPWEQVLSLNHTHVNTGYPWWHAYKSVIPKTRTEHVNYAMCVQGSNWETGQWIWWRVIEEDSPYQPCSYTQMHMHTCAYAHTHMCCTERHMENQPTHLYTCSYTYMYHTYIHEMYIHICIHTGTLYTCSTCIYMENTCTHIPHT